MNIRNLTDVKTLLFDNITIKQTLFKNTFWISVSAGVSKVLRAILIIYIARILGATEYGKFTFVLAFVSMFVVLFNFGLPSIITREFSQAKEREKEFSSLFSLKVLMGLGALILIFIGSFFITSDQEIQKLIWILSLFTFISHFPEILYSFLRARQRMEYESWANILQAVLVTAFGFFVILNFPSVKNISYGYLFSSFIALIPLLIFFHFKIFPLNFSFETTIWKKFLAMSWPLALISIVGMIYNYIDSVMMGYLGQITQTGWYNAALKIVNVALLPAWIISLNFYPVLSKFAKESREKFQEIWNDQMEIMIFLALPIVVGGLIIAPRLIDFVYGTGFSSSVLALQILIFMAGIAFLCNPLGQVLVATNHQQKILWVTFWGSVINVVLNLILIPKFSLYGAAVASVITYILMLILYLKFTYKFTSLKPLNLKIFLVFLGAIFSSIVMYFIISYSKIYHLNVLLSISIGAIFYTATYFVFKKMLRYLTVLS